MIPLFYFARMGLNSETDINFIRYDKGIIVRVVIFGGIFGNGSLLAINGL